MLAPLRLRLELTPGVLLSTTTTRSGARAESEHRLMATLEDGGVRLSWTNSAGPRAASGATGQEALVALWPEDAPPLAPAQGAPNPAALKAACLGRAEATMKAAGPALTPVLMRLMDFPRARPSGGVLERWARARAHLATPRTAGTGLRSMAQVVRALESGQWAPTWRRPAAGPQPSAMLLAGRLYVFAEGTLLALEASTGREHWRREVGRVEPLPALTPLGLLVFGDRGLTRLSPETGEVLGQLSLPGAYPEWVTSSDVVVVGGEDLLVALDARTADVRWRVGLDRLAASGPVALGDTVAVAVGTEVRLYDLATGELRKRTPLAEPLSSPLLATRQGRLWALAGSDRVLEIEPRRGRVRRRLGGIRGAQWPLMRLGERVVVPTRRGRRDEWVMLGGGRPRRSPGVGPWVQRSDFRGALHLDRGGRTLVGRDAAFDVTFRLALPRSATALAESGGQALVGVGARILVVDAEGGRRRHELVGEAPVLALEAEPEGGAALLENGVLYGWAAPEALRASWLRMARHDVARLALAAGRSDQARAAAEAARARAQDDVVAARLLRAAAWRARDPAAVEASLQTLAQWPPQTPAGRAAQDELSVLGTWSPRPGPAPEAGRPRLTTTATRSAPEGFGPVLASARFDERSVFLGSGRWQELGGPRPLQVRWRAPARGATILGAELRPERSVIWTESGVEIVAKGRRRRVSLPRPPSLAATVGDWGLTYDGRSLVALDLARGRRLGALPLRDVAALEAADAEIRVHLRNRGVLSLPAGSDLRIPSRARPRRR